MDRQQRIERIVQLLHDSDQQRAIELLQEGDSERDFIHVGQLLWRNEQFELLRKFLRQGLLCLETGEVGLLALGTQLVPVESPSSITAFHPLSTKLEQGYEIIEDLLKEHPASLETFREVVLQPHRRSVQAFKDAKSPKYG